MMDLPVVNLSSFTSSTCNGHIASADKDACAKNLVKAASEQGFLYLTGHGVSDELLTQAIEWSRRFFALPLEVKKEIDIIKSRSTRGYQTLGLNVTKGRRDRHEGVDLYRDTDEPSEDHTGPTNMGRNQWLDEGKHEEIKGFREFWEERYIPAMLRLGSLVMEAFAVGLGLASNYFTKFYENSFWVMRFLHYPWVRPEELQPGELGCGVHTDYGCLTLLLADDTPDCLQAQSRSGEWVMVNPMVKDGEKAFVVNLGDMLERWTGGKVRATPHRVLPPLLPCRNPEKTGRISVPFFFEPNYDAVIRPVDELLEPGLKLSAPVVYGSHLLSKSSNNFSFQKGTLQN